MSLTLKRFNISTITDDSVIVFIGKRRTGKSVLVKDMLYYHRDIPCGTVISGTEEANKFYGHFTPSIFIHGEVSPLLLDTVVKRQKNLKRIIESGKGSNVDARSVLILDDCLFDNAWVKDKNIRCLFMNGRHYNVLFMITMQYPLGIPPNLRTNIDYVFILRENNINNRKRIYENYASMFPSFEMFCSVMDQCTENYECLVIIINSMSNKLQDQVFWYKAEPHPDFKIGAEDFWLLSAQKEKERMANNKDEDEDSFNASSFKKKFPLQVLKSRSSKSSK
jgi:hypothetical protein